MTASARAALVPAGLAVAAALLWHAGSGDLAAPPPDPSAFGPWVDERGAVAASFALVRLAALAVAAWWTLVAAVALGARAVGAARAADLAGRRLPEPLRRAVSGAVTMSVVGLGAAACSSGPDAAPAGESLVLLPGDSSAEVAEGGATAVMSVLPDEPAEEEREVDAPEPAPAPAPPRADAWTVEPGDSFWSIAEEVLADALGRPASDDEITDYWRALIAANHDRLVSGSPDLVHPGQAFVLPPVRA